MSDKYVWTKDERTTWDSLPGAEDHQCDHEGCNCTETVTCQVSDTDKKLTWVSFYCSEHAEAEGFCFGCGGFWAGVESFDFGEMGLCEICLDELRAAVGEYDHEWDF